MSRGAGVLHLGDFTLTILFCTRSSSSVDSNKCLETQSALYVSLELLSILHGLYHRTVSLIESSVSIGHNGVQV